MNALTPRTRRRSFLACAWAGALLLSLTACSSAGGEENVRGLGTAPKSPPPKSSAPNATAPLPEPTARTRTLSKADYLHPDGLYFGLATFHAPARATTASATRAAGRHPRILEYYQGWDEPFSAANAELSYQQGALPLVTWEPFGDSRDRNQPRYALKRIATGSYDAYVIRFARQVKATGQPIVLRLAHEMNGDWYPWSERNSGNRPGDYVKAWRHVHDLFQAVGATEVIWVWSPNVPRGTGGTALRPLYPGDDYVDWIGLDGYGFGERTATEVLQPALDTITRFTGKPILLTETGSSPGPHQAGWTADLFRWIKRTPNVIGFIWFQHSEDEGGQYDYRFDIDPRTKAAFRQGLDSLHLRDWPVTPEDSP
ncbi:glycoside hydrolase family 26 protein [Streptomyces sp.]|uniref:glycoside hydrolase family 26 protein n=1 Tax=Streptomyces sp. TaxID=1931 RepID=UPI002F3E3EEC